jgi:replication factor C subunit 1
LPGYPEFAGWLGKNSSRNKRIRLLQELRHHMNYRVSADGPELRMNYLPVMRQQFQELLFHKDGANVTEAIELMDEYGIDRDDLFENLDEFVLAITGEKEKKFGDLDSKAKAAFTRAYNQVAHKSEALVAEQGIGKSGRRKSTSGASEMGETGELDVVDDDKAAAAQDDDEQDDEEDVEALIEMFMKKKKKAATTASKSKGTKGGTSSKGKKK